MAKASKSKTFLISRDAKSGQFVSVKQATRGKPSTTRSERPPKGGHGNTLAIGRDSKTGRFVEERHTVSGRSVETLSKITKKRSKVLKNLAKR